jgi:hypothetical protein
MVHLMAGIVDLALEQRHVARGKPHLSCQSQTPALREALNFAGTGRMASPANERPACGASGSQTERLGRDQ